MRLLSRLLLLVFLTLSAPVLAQEAAAPAASTDQAAEELISPDFAAMSPLHIPEELQETKEYVQPLGENESLFQDIWTSFKLG